MLLVRGVRRWGERRTDDCVVIVIYLMTNFSRRLCSATRKTILERKQTPRDQGRGLCPRPSRRLFARSRIFGVLLKHKAKRRCVVRSIILSSWPRRRYIYVRQYVGWCYGYKQASVHEFSCTNSGACNKILYYQQHAVADNKRILVYNASRRILVVTR